jgi:hypothetical protein
MEVGTESLDDVKVYVLAEFYDAAVEVSVGPPADLGGTGSVSPVFH